MHLTPLSGARSRVLYFRIPASIRSSVVKKGPSADSILVHLPVQEKCGAYVSCVLIDFDEYSWEPLDIDPF